MADLSQQIGFTALFDLTAQIPTLILTDNGNYPSPALTSRQGFFRVVTPDGSVRNFPTNPDTTASTLLFSYPLPTALDGTVQQGTYNISFQLIATGFDNTTFNRTFVLDFNPVQTAISETIDLSIPRLYYNDNTGYNTLGYNAPSVSRAWSANSAPTGTFTSNAPVFDLIHGGSYFNSLYTVSLAATATYISTANAWLSVKYLYNTTGNANTVPVVTWDELLSWVTELKQNCKNKFQFGYQQANMEYVFAMALLTHIRYLACEDQYTGIDEYIKELFRATHNNVFYNPTYTNTVLVANAGLCGCNCDDNTTIPTALSITTQPQSQSVAQGSNATLSVAATGGTTPYHYQWQFNGTPISGATSSSYTTGVAGAYVCVVTDSSTTVQSVSSSAATITVTTVVQATIYYGIGAVPTTDGQIVAGSSISITAGSAFTITWPSNATPQHYWVAQPSTEPAKVKDNDGMFDEPIGTDQTFQSSTVGTHTVYSTENPTSQLVTTLFKLS